MAVPSDLRRALRSLARRRTFAVTVVLTLALALAFSIPTVVLSTVDRHFWRPLDLAESDRLFTLQLQVDDGRFSPLSHPEYVQLRDAGTEAFSLATFGQFDFTLVADGVPTRANVALVSDNFFTLLGAVPAHGRLLVPSDDDPDAAAAVLSHRARTTQFGRDPDLVGRTVRLGPQVLTVVDIAANPLPGPVHEPDFWVPVSALSQLLADSAGILLGPAARWLNTVGRLRLSTSRSEAAVLAALAKARLPADVAATRTERGLGVSSPGRSITPSSSPACRRTPASRSIRAPRMADCVSRPGHRTLLARIMRRLASIQVDMVDIGTNPRILMAFVLMVNDALGKGESFENAATQKMTNLEINPAARAGDGTTSRRSTPERRRDWRDKDES